MTTTREPRVADDPAPNPHATAEQVEAALKDSKLAQVLYHDWEAETYDDKWSISYDKRCVDYARDLFDATVPADELRRLPYERALELEPECVEALYNIANIHFKKKHYAVAIRYFQGCIQYEPDFPEAYYNLGLLYYSLSYLEPARACLEQYLELDPDSDWADQAREWLREIGGRLKNQAESRNFSLFAVDGPEGN